MPEQLTATLSPQVVFDVAIKGRPVGRFVIAQSWEGFVKLQNERGEMLIVELPQVASDPMALLQGGVMQEAVVMKLSNSLMPQEEAPLTLPPPPSQQEQS